MFLAAHVLHVRGGCCDSIKMLVRFYHSLQEIVGLGLANFAGSAFNAYSTTGSFSRSAVNYDSGVRPGLHLP